MTEPSSELLLRRNHITPDQLKKALEEQKLKGGRLESKLFREGLVGSSSHKGSSPLFRTNKIKRLAKY